VRRENIRIASLKPSIYSTSSFGSFLNRVSKSVVYEEELELEEMLEIGKEVKILILALLVEDCSQSYWIRRRNYKTIRVAMI